MLVESGRHINVQHSSVSDSRKESVAYQYRSLCSSIDFVMHFYTKQQIKLSKAVSQKSIRTSVQGSIWSECAVLWPVRTSVLGNI